MSMDCCKDNEHLVTKEEKEDIFVVLVKKTANAKYSDEFRAYREAHTVRGWKHGATGMAFRNLMKSFNG